MLLFTHPPSIIHLIKPPFFLALKSFPTSYNTHTSPSLNLPHHRTQMGNSAAAATGEVILSNGAVFTYDSPLTVAELMLEHPQEVVVEFQPVVKGKKPTPLPADEKLEANKLYLMLPVRRGKPSPLSSEEAHKLLTKTNSFLKSKPLLSYTGFLPLFVRICPAVVGVLVDEKKNKCLGDGRCRKEEEEEEEGMKGGGGGDYFMDILEGGRPEFLSRQISGKGWKPSLDTIKEKSVRPKVPNWII